MDKAVKNRIAEYIIMVGLSFATMIALAQVCDYGITGIDLMLPCVFALCLIVFSKIKSLWIKEKNAVRRELKFTVPLGSVSAICAVTGCKIDLDTRTFAAFGIKDIAFILILIPFFVAIFSLLFFSSDALTISISEDGVVKRDETKRKLSLYTLKNSLIMLICWLPYYLTYYPGGIGNDIFESVRMCKGSIPLTNHHPVAFTGIIKLFLAVFKDETLALGIMVLVQMIIVAVTLSLVVSWLRFNRCARIIRVGAILFFALHPIVAVYSIYLTKDVIFSCIVVILVLFLFDYCKAEKENGLKNKIRNHAILGLLILSTMLTRNNGTLVAIITLVAVFAVFKTLRKYVAVTFLVIMVLWGIYKGPVWSMLGVEKQSFAESAAIPLTQVAYTIYTDGDISAENRTYLEGLMPFDKVRTSFYPGYVDTYKFDKDFNTELLDENPGRFMKVWMSLLPDNFGRYVQAYLFETCGYWNYGVTNTVATEGVQENSLGIEGRDYFERLTGTSLKDILAELILVARKLPVLCFISQMAIEILAVVLLAWQFARRKHSYLIAALMPFIAIWISVMIASPAYCLFRYMCPVFFAWPVIIERFFAIKQ